MIEDDIDRLFMTGTRATFTLKKDAKVDEKVVAEALKKKGLKFVSLKSEERDRAGAAYVAKTPGLT
ncbi:MAG: hypothetical protein AAF726_03820 [Planctomycetota bacterium]